MFETIDKTQRVWIYDTHLQRFIYYFPTMRDALKFLASNEESSTWSPIGRNEFLDRINLGNDETIFSYINPRWSDEIYDYLHDGKIYGPRKYIFVDGEDRYIDFRIYRDEIKKLAREGDTDYECYPKRKKRWSRYPSAKFRFRIDPVPGTGHWRKYCWLRHVRTTNERRQNSAPEIKEFVRPARRAHNLPTVYDDIRRGQSRSWKDCTKKRKQWM